MQNESKGVYVQMPKPDNDDAVKLLAELFDAVESGEDCIGCDAYYAAKEYLEKNKVLSEVTV